MSLTSISTLVLGLVLLCFIELSNCVGVIGIGNCPSVSAQSTLDKSAYLGVWYEYKRFPAIFEAGLDCVTATYGDQGSSLSVVNSGYYRVDWFGNRVVLARNTIDGAATIPDPAKPAELSVSFGGADFGGDTPNYFIKETDYTSYSVVFSCTQLPFFNIQFAWILTRAPGAVPSNLGDLENNLSADGVDVSKLELINQSGCPS